LLGYVCAGAFGAAASAASAASDAVFIA
jgi:hypothetical protein